MVPNGNMTYTQMYESILHYYNLEHKKLCIEVPKIIATFRR